jgi:hypothetical protein
MLQGINNKVEPSEFFGKKTCMMMHILNSSLKCSTSLDHQLLFKLGYIVNNKSERKFTQLVHLLVYCNQIEGEGCIKWSNTAGIPVTTKGDEVIIMVFRLANEERDIIQQPRMLTETLLRIKEKDYEEYI